jgi:hypothetical protein
MRFVACWRTGLFGVVAGLFLGSFVAWFMISCIAMFLGPGEVGPALAAGLLITFTALLIGTIPALLYGPLAYALLLYYERANVLSAIAIGALPAAIVFVSKPLWPEFDGLAMWVLAYGVPVSIATHVTIRFGRI